MKIRSRALVAVIGLVLLASAGACGSSSSSGSGGVGGTGAGASAGSSGVVAGAPGSAGASMGGAPGSVGAGGMSGGAAGNAGSFVANCGGLPACVAQVVAACPMAADCSIGTSGSGDTLTRNFCFGTGVKAVQLIRNDMTTNMGTTTITVMKNGVTCYTLSATYSNDATGPRVYSFKDASTVELATFTVDSSTLPASTTVTCGGVSTPVTDFGNCGMPANPELDTCVGGRCVVP